MIKLPVADRVHVLSANEKPTPVTVTVTPIRPLPGIRVIAGPVTMKVASTKLGLPVPPELVTLTVYVPGFRFPTTKLPLKGLRGFGAATITHDDDLSERPLPDPPPTVQVVAPFTFRSPLKDTSVPEGPDEGIMLMKLAPTSKVADAVSPAMLPVPITR